MPTYVVFMRTAGTSGNWGILSRIVAKDDLDAWYQARWGVTSNTSEVLIKKTGFFSNFSGNDPTPSADEVGRPPFTAEERATLQDATAVNRRLGLDTLKRLNEGY
jgi:hypothetical protein